MTSRGVQILRALRRGRNALLWAQARIVCQVIERLPLERALRVGETLGALAYAVLRTRRRVTAERIRIAFGDTISPSARRRLARAVFVNMARCLCELANIDEVRRRGQQYFELAGDEHLRSLRARGEGAILVTGQVGNWELLAPYWAWHGIPVAVIARRPQGGRIDHRLREFRARQGVSTITPESPLAGDAMRSVTKESGFLAVLVDRDPRSSAVPMPYVGRMARDPSAAASLALRTGLPLVPVFIQRRSRGGHRITVQAPIRGANGADRRTAVRTLARQVGEVLEAHVRRNPAECGCWHAQSGRAREGSLDRDHPFQYTDSHSP